MDQTIFICINSFIPTYLDLQSSIMADPPRGLPSSGQQAMPNASQGQASNAHPPPSLHVYRDPSQNQLQFQGPSWHQFICHAGLLHRRHQLDLANLQREFHHSTPSTAQLPAVAAEASLTSLATQLEQWPPFSTVLLLPTVLLLLFSII